MLYICGILLVFDTDRCPNMVVLCLDGFLYLLVDGVAGARTLLGSKPREFEEARVQRGCEDNLCPLHIEEIEYSRRI